MNAKKLAAIVVGASLWAMPSLAGEKLTKDEVLALISGASYETSSGNQGKINADGTLSATSARGSTSEGTWKVNDDGEYCNSWNNPRWTGSCAPFEKSDEPNVYLRAVAEGGTARYTFKK